MNPEIKIKTPDLAKLDCTIFELFDKLVEHRIDFTVNELNEDLSIKRVVMNALEQFALITPGPEKEPMFFSIVFYDNDDINKPIVLKFKYFEDVVVNFCKYGYPSKRRHNFSTIIDIPSKEFIKNRIDNSFIVDKFYVWFIWMRRHITYR